MRLSKRSRTANPKRFVLSMNVGDRVRHKTKRKIAGVIESFGKYDSVIVNLSSTLGVSFRKFRKKDLEVIDEERRFSQSQES